MLSVSVVRSCPHFLAIQRRFSPTSSAIVPGGEQEGIKKEAWEEFRFRNNKEGKGLTNGNGRKSRSHMIIINIQLSLSQSLTHTLA